MRPSKRALDEMRKVSFERGVARYAEGSCLVRFGETHVLCAASLEDKPPPWLRGQGRGWVTAEYAMLPRATSTRTRRESPAGKVSGHAHGGDYGRLDRAQRLPEMDGPALDPQGQSDARPCRGDFLRHLSGRGCA